jgi:hypothetical protein
VTERSDDPGESDLSARVRRLHEHLRATAELPVESAANRWIGEAEAVAGDLVGEDVDPDVVKRRVGHVADLLANVDGTGDPEANDHVVAAREIAAELSPEA